MPIVFVVVAAVFSCAVSDARFFATQEPPEVLYTSVEKRHHPILKSARPHVQHSA